MRALERHPDDRYQSAYDLADDLEGFLRDAAMHSGPVRIARYLDELATAAGGQRRPELISEHEHAADEEDLDFDSEVFGGFQPAAAAVEPAAAAWDEYEESDAAVAAALGMDLREFRVARTPSPARRSSGAGGVPVPDADTDPMSEAPGTGAKRNL